MLMGIVPDKNKTYKSTFSFLTNQLDYFSVFQFLYLLFEWNKTGSGSKDDKTSTRKNETIGHRQCVDI